MEKKIAVVTDSNKWHYTVSGEGAWLYVLPMPFMINESPFFEDITRRRTVL